MAARCRWLIALLWLAVASPALADSPARPRSYKEVAPGGKYVFVMIAPGTVEKDVWSWNEETAAGIREIRRVYTRSGMYRNDGSAEPIWTVDWYAHHVYLTPDGVHLIRPGPWATFHNDKTPNLDVEAVSFFANGRLLRTYQVSELIDDTSSTGIDSCSVSARARSFPRREWAVCPDGAGGSRWVWSPWSRLPGSAGVDHRRGG